MILLLVLISVVGSAFAHPGSHLGHHNKYVTLDNVKYSYGICKLMLDLSWIGRLMLLYSSCARWSDRRSLRLVHLSAGADIGCSGVAVFQQRLEKWIVL